ncbi:MAG TPA: bifunctional glutamate N-acetyltransferase/amino-acid acetyltransferase ArgJ [Vicinamibacteria bacterium]|nr:bifunctional glutamate N-acetyltransferase/amino-acid acetyltransferase ArgJ [Vicinamibacteria bacterium]
MSRGSGVEEPTRKSAALGAISAPLGFRAAGVASGIKSQGLDLAVVAADWGSSAAAVFTTNRAQAAPVLVSREHLGSGQARAVVVNAGCANAATGDRGLSDARETAALTAQALGCRPSEVLVASTGVIGVPLPMEKLRAGIPEVVARLAREGGASAAQAILTTDTHPKEVMVEFLLDGQTAHLGGMAKGAGMIAPNLATMLAFFTTDAALDPGLLRRALSEAVGASLNRITVDGDTSTNDMALILASGALPARAILEDGKDYDAFRGALTEAASRLAQMIVRDGEGATRVAAVRVEGARAESEADRVARTVAESPLVKTALHGGDPNWGRILAAAGRSGVELDVSRLDIHLGNVWVCQGGAARDYDEAAAHQAMLEDPVRIRIHLNEGRASGWIWTSDLSRGYVDINAHYRS